MDTCAPTVAPDRSQARTRSNTEPVFLAVEGLQNLYLPSSAFFSLSLQSEASSLAVSRTITTSVQPRGPVQACTGGQRRCGSPFPTPGHLALYHSLLHQQSAPGQDGVEHYTPPPMLCPLRAGPGLYCSLTTWKQQRACALQLCYAPGETLKLLYFKKGTQQFDSFLCSLNRPSLAGDLVAMETASPPSGTLTTGINKPYVQRAPQRTTQNILR